MLRAIRCHEVQKAAFIMLLCFELLQPCFRHAARAAATRHADALLRRAPLLSAVI